MYQVGNGHLHEFSTKHDSDIHVKQSPLGVSYPIFLQCWKYSHICRLKTTVNVGGPKTSTSSHLWRLTCPRHETEMRRAQRQCLINIPIHIWFMYVFFSNPVFLQRISLRWSSPGNALAKTLLVRAVTSADAQIHLFYLLDAMVYIFNGLWAAIIGMALSLTKLTVKGRINHHNASNHETCHFSEERTIYLSESAAHVYIYISLPGIPFTLYTFYQSTYLLRKPSQVLLDILHCKHVLPLHCWGFFLSTALCGLSGEPVHLTPYCSWKTLTSRPDIGDHKVHSFALLSMYSTWITCFLVLTHFSISYVEERWVWHGFISNRTRVPAPWCIRNGIVR